MHCEEGHRGECPNEVFAVIGIDALGTIVPAAGGALCLDHLAQNINGFVTEYGRVTIGRADVSSHAS